MAIQGDGNWDINWPYPQIRETDYYTIGVTLNDDDEVIVCELVNENDEWTATQIYNLGDVEYIEFVDVQGWGPFYVVAASKMIDGVLQISSFMRYPDGTTTDIPNAAVPPFAAVCDYNGQPIIAGINSNTAPWENLLYSSVAWAGIGGAFDFRPTEPGNETSGFIHIPSPEQGKTRTMRVKQLGKAIMCYTPYDVHGLFPHSIGRSGFGRVSYSWPGIASPNHLTGSGNIHLYLGVNDELISVTSNMEFHRLGYKEYMQLLNKDEIRMTHVPQKKRFYISDSQRSFVLTENGLIIVDGIKVLHLPGIIVEVFSVDSFWILKIGSHGSLVIH